VFPSNFPFFPLLFWEYFQEKFLLLGVGCGWPGLFPFSPPRSFLFPPFFSFSSTSCTGGGAPQIRGLGTKLGSPLPQYERGKRPSFFPFFWGDKVTLFFGIFWLGRFFLDRGGSKLSPSFLPQTVGGPPSSFFGRILRSFKKARHRSNPPTFFFCFRGLGPPPPSPSQNGPRAASFFFSLFLPCKRETVSRGGPAVGSPFSLFRPRPPPPPCAEGPKFFLSPTSSTKSVPGTRSFPPSPFYPPQRGTVLFFPPPSFQADHSP